MKISKALIKSDPVHAALMLAQRAIATDPQQARLLLTQRRADLRRATDLRADLLSVERDEALALDLKISEINKDIKSLVAQLVPSPVSMPIFDLDCLAWRDAQGFPRLVPFAIDNPKVVFGVRARYVTNTYPYSRRIRTQNHGTRFPSEISKCYKDVFATLRDLRQPKKSIEIATVFGGAIPDDIRDLIQGARSVFDDLRIVAEVPWTVIERNAKPVLSLKGDPLLIGHDGANYRLLAAFDTTSIEQIALERSRGRKGS